MKKICLSSLIGFEKKQLLKSILYRIKDKKVYELINNKKVIFIHIPKSAGMSVTMSLFGKEVGHNTALYYKRILGKKAYEKVYCFSIVRNPYDRLMSAYFFLKGGGMSKYCNDVKMSEYINLKYPSFKQFVMEGLKDQKIMTYYHFVPQYKFLVDEQGKIIVSHIGKLEEIEPFYKKVCDDLDVKIKLPHNNRTEYPKRKSELYTPEMQLIVHQIYKEDLELFNYEFK